ncbi:four-carbon acid sugar kinase family protein [Plantibacter sp. VKM Ac-2880]|uniref:four-carbon acid sugar kinase family protein n=1 Tax=Plantibacter sp. VKM Ac-2880 TaxID=2783827 RepID=UPI00188FCD16|nr:four-carbon acid sugar kinase family protein [Plantibacter sp. VKM Ac-2880]MBF4568093.1 four-carbon acid sugar kinase family protein [Plantibacter sp. VKM Ac-2880]
MKTLILDDDPTGTQSASGVDVLLEWDADLLETALGSADAVYLLTNTRAVPEDEAVSLLERTRDQAAEAGRRLGERIHVVLRGDSTLRGHVFPETAVFTGDRSVIVFVPAFPEGGRTTIDGTHYVRIGDETLPAHETEYAQDPVFPFRSGHLPDYVREQSGREAAHFGLAGLRDGATEFRAALRDAVPGTVLLPDAETGDDVRIIAQAVTAAWADGADVVVRSASPLAAAIAGVESDGLLPSPLVSEPIAVLLVCGSHTIGATRQLAPVEAAFGPAETVPTSDALQDPVATGRAVAEVARPRLAATGFAAISSERERDAAHNTLDHGERVMIALTSATAALRRSVEVVVSKGGITSAEVARVGLGARRARVLGQVLPGVSVWSVVTPEDEEKLYVVVPGNVGDPSTLVDVLTALGRTA